jgi:putative heme-binding domain-containing protein
MNSWEVRRASDKELSRYIHDGVSGTAMPGFSLPEGSIRELAAYVRSLNSPANSVPVTGDAQAGASIFRGKGGCAGCHMIRGRGGFLGPDLSDIGAKKRLGEIREAIVNPAKLSTNGYRAVTLTDATGHSLRGILKQASSWSSSVLDEHGKLHLLRGADMQRATLQDEQWMPLNYAQLLSPAEIQNLLAFLSQQSLVQPGQPFGNPQSPVKEPN